MGNTSSSKKATEERKTLEVKLAMRAKEIHAKQAVEVKALMMSTAEKVVKQRVEKTASDNRLLEHSVRLANLSGRDLDGFPMVPGQTMTVVYRDAYGFPMVPKSN